MFKNSLSSRNAVTSEEWKWFFQGAGNYVEQNEIFELNNFDLLREIIKTLKVVIEKSHLLPEDLKENTFIQDLGKLRNKSVIILLELRFKSFSKTPKFYENLGKTLKNIARVIKLLVIVSAVVSGQIEIEKSKSEMGLENELICPLSLLDD